MAISFKGAHFPPEIILMGVRWYVAYPLSTRHVEELMLERGVPVDHSPINRWVIRSSPQLEEAFHRRKWSVWVSWRMDETYIRVKGEWHYLYRAVDKYNQTIDFLLTKERDEQAAKRFLTKAIRRHGVPAKITIDGSEANAAAIRSYNKDHGTAIVIRQVKYLNNVVEQDHRGVKRVTRPMLGFKSFEAAQGTLAGIELMHMLKKRQRVVGSCTRTLRLIPLPPKPGKIPPSHHSLWRGQCHGLTPFLLPTRPVGHHMALRHVAPHLDQAERDHDHRSSHTHHAQAHPLHRAQSVRGSDAQAPLRLV